MDRKRTIILRIALTLAVFRCMLVLSQNPSILFNPHNQVLTSQYFPGKIGSGYKSFEITLPSIHADVGNNAISFRQVHELLTNGDTDADLRDIIYSLKRRNYISAEADVPAFGVSFNIKDSERNNLASVSLSFREFISGNFAFSGNLIRLLYEGNEQFAGERIEITPLEINAIAYHEFAAGLAIPFIMNTSKKEIGIIPGIRFRYLLGDLSIQTESSQLYMFTESNGEFIEFDFGYEFRSSLPDDRWKYFSKPAGRGFAVDIGSGIEISDRFRLDVSLRDLGFINFSQNTKNFYRSGEYTFEGIELDIWNGEDIDISILDTLQDEFEPVETETTYKLRLKPELGIMGNFNLGSRVKKNGLNYYRHSFYVIYLQGFDRFLDKSIVPIFGAGYTFSAGNIFNVGPNISFGGDRRFKTGFQMSVKGGPFKFSLGSSDISILILRKRSFGIDFHTAFALTF